MPLLDVMTISPPYTPELLPHVQTAIEDILSGGGSVFEFGSGHSTLWFAALGADVVTVEHNQDWYGAVMAELDQANLLDNVNAHLVVEARIPFVIDRYGLFDLVLIDCLDRYRMKATARSLMHVKPGGYLVIDDSHWSIFDPLDNILKTWQPIKIMGLHKRKSGKMRIHHTTFYRKPQHV